MAAEVVCLYSRGSVSRSSDVGTESTTPERVPRLQFSVWHSRCKPRRIRAKCGKTPRSDIPAIKELQYSRVRDKSLHKLITSLAVWRKEVSDSKIT